MKNFRPSRRFNDAFLREFDREQQVQDQAYFKLFKTAQLCWWYIMYSPDYDHDWSEDEMKIFTDKAKKNIKKIDTEDICNQEKEKLLKDTGIDCKKLGKEFPYTVKVKMYGRKPKFDDLRLISFQFSQAIEEALFIELHALYYIYHQPVSVLEKMIDDFMEFSKLYGQGLKDEHMIKYFEEIEKIPVLEEKDE